MWFAADLTVPGESSIMKGFLRSIATENVLAKYAFIELDLSNHTSEERTAELLIYKLKELHRSAENIDKECVLSGGIFHVERLLPESTLNEQFSLRQGGTRLQRRGIGFAWTGESEV